MNAIQQLLLNQINIFELILKTEVLLDPVSLEMYAIRGEFLVPTLSPEEHHPISWMNEKKLLSKKDFQNSENLGFLQENNGTFTEVLRKTLRNTNGIPTEQLQLPNGNSTDFLQQLNSILAELAQQYSKKIPKLTQKYLDKIFEEFEDVKPFSDRYKGNIKKYAQQIEAYSYSSLYTTKSATIKNIRADFETAKNLALKGKIIQIEQLRDKVKARRIKQTKTKAIENAANKKANAKRIKILVLAGFFTVFGILAIAKSIYNGLVTPTPSKQQTTEIYHHSDIIFLIEEYEIENNSNVYPWRREQIKIFLPEEFTKEDIYTMCDLNYKF